MASGQKPTKTARPFVAIYVHALLFVTDGFPRSRMLLYSRLRIDHLNIAAFEQLIRNEPSLKKFSREFVFWNSSCQSQDNPDGSDKPKQTVTRATMIIHKLKTVEAVHFTPVN
ncbi:hypothetical protein QCA50_009768 [Cerrena zonata]|uniref:Uncharacterized protein n=1 Tax=Cerrena zonata TaxID=2478898 RepID=A0AAW0G0K4_9APHY